MDINLTPDKPIKKNEKDALKSGRFYFCRIPENARKIYSVIYYAMDGKIYRKAVGRITVTAYKKPLDNRRTRKGSTADSCPAAESITQTADKTQSQSALSA